MHKLKIVIHDYAGHPFQVQLSRELARRGHQISHIYAASIQTPRGALEKKADDPPSLEIEGISLSKPFQKHNFFRRRYQEHEYGKLLAERVAEIQPDWIVSGNTPTEPQAILLKRCKKRGIRFVSWVQDFYGIAVHKLLRRRIPLLGSAIGQYYMRLDRWVLRNSDRVILITEDFVPLTREMGIPDDRIAVIENWAPLDELPLRPKDNSWSREHGLHDKFVFLYSGTLGMKHNPALLLALARHYRSDSLVRVVVVSEGIGATWLHEQKAEQGLDSLVVTPFQPFERLPEVLAAAEVLVAILEPDAGVFSVPSKALTYFCAGKPLLAAMPAENLAARSIERTGAGLVVDPGDAAGVVAAGDRFRRDTDLRRSLGQEARAHAEQTFGIERIAHSFERVFS